MQIEKKEKKDASSFEYRYVVCVREREIDNIVIFIYSYECGQEWVPNCCQRFITDVM